METPSEESRDGFMDPVPVGNDPATAAALLVLLDAAQKFDQAVDDFLTRTKLGPLPMHSLLWPAIQFRMLTRQIIDGAEIASL